MPPPAPRSPTGRHRADGEAVDQQRARVVQQALAFQDAQQALRRTQRAQHRGRGHRVGRGDDGTQRDGCSPGQARHEDVGDDGHRSRREAHRDDHQADERHPVVAKIPQRRVIAGIDQDGRHEKGQHQIGRKAQRSAHRERKPEARRRSPGTRIRRAHAPRGGGQRHGRHEERQDLLELSHGFPTSSAKSCVSES